MLGSFKQRLMNGFEMSNLVLLHYFLGLEVTQGRDEMFVSQKYYAKSLLRCFYMEHCKKAITPMNKNEKLQAEDGTYAADASRFRSLIGGLIYLPNTRPDIAYSVSTLSRKLRH